MAKRKANFKMLDFKKSRTEHGIDIHVVKILPSYFKAVKNREKTFEIRNNDRNFKVGDVVELMEYFSDEDRFTGNGIRVKIKYITDYNQPKNQVVFSFDFIEEFKGVE